MTTTWEDVRDAELKLEAVKSKYLKERGWKYGCGAPGSFWYWAREYKGLRWTSLTLESAISLQRGIDFEEEF